MTRVVNSQVCCPSFYFWALGISEERYSFHILAGQTALLCSTPTLPYQKSNVHHVDSSFYKVSTFGLFNAARLLTHEA
jgi:hypothetical protein